MMHCILILTPATTPLRPLEITLIRIQTFPAILILGPAPHPPSFLPFDTLPKIIRNTPEIQVQPITQEPPNLRVLHTAPQRPAPIPITGIDIHIHSTMPMRRPPDLAPPAYHIRQQPTPRQTPLLPLSTTVEQIDLLVSSIVTAHPDLDELVPDPRLHGVPTRRDVRPDMIVELVGEVRGAVAGVGEDGGEPVVLWVGGMELAGRGQAAGFVVRGADDHRLGLLVVGVVVVVGEGQGGGEGAIVFYYLVDLRDGIVGVTCVVDPGALDHEEEALVAVPGGGGEGVEGRMGHLGKGGVDVGLGAAVDFVGDVG